MGPSKAKGRSGAQVWAGGTATRTSPESGGKKECTLKKKQEKNIGKENNPYGELRPEQGGGVRRCHTKAERGKGNKNRSPGLSPETGRKMWGGTSAGDKQNARDDSTLKRDQTFLAGRHEGGTEKGQ